jgi:pyruvate/2-oxoglutarate dehydrogenase complex dihydrolipoamide acyltransferase (E2) component
MKRSIKLVAVALLAAALISQWRRVKELGRQVLSGRREEPAPEDPGTVSRPAGSQLDATKRVEEAVRVADESESRVRVTPAAERRAKELGVDLSRVEGTGSGGRITVRDVQRAAENRTSR